MANTLLTPSIVTRESLRILENNLTFAKGVNREYDNRFASSGGKIGATLNIRKPPRFTVSSGAALAIQDVTDTQVPLVITNQDHVDTNFTTQELTLQVEDFSDRILRPKMAALANVIDFNGLTQFKEVYNQVGTPGTTPSTLVGVLQVGEKMDYEATPRDGMRSLVINPTANASLVGAFSGLFNNSDKISTQYDTGNLGASLGFKISMDQNINVQTVGPLGGTPAVNGAGQGIAIGAADTTALITNGWTAAAALRLNKGDVFTIAAVFAVNPQSRQTTSQLRQFTVINNTSSDAGGNATITVSPAIITGGPFQTVTVSPANGALLTVIGAANAVYPVNMGYHRDAFTLATVDLENPESFGAWGSREVYKGVSLRTVRQYRIGTDDVPCRVDVLYGWKTIYRELACRLAG